MSKILNTCDRNYLAARRRDAFWRWCVAGVRADRGAEWRYGLAHALFAACWLHAR